MVRKGFTLIELLVVIAVITLLVSILMPSLSKAKLLAGDARCAVTMRGALLACQIYNSEWAGGITNYFLDCPWFNKGYPDYPNLGYPYYSSHIEFAGQSHIWAEGRARRPIWRETLLNAGYASPETLGCTATDFTNRKFYSAYNCQMATDKEAPDSPAMKRAPCFVWYGPGTFDPDNVNEYSGGNLSCPEWNNNYIGQRGPQASWLKETGPIFTCPQVCIDRSGDLTGIPGAVEFQPSHRPAWLSWTFGSLKTLSVAENIGFSDGHVKFFAYRNERAEPFTFNPNRLR